MKKEVKVDAVKVISNMLSLGITINRSGDGAMLVLMSDTIISKKPRWQEIKYNINGEPYVTYRGTKHYLSEFMRVSKSSHYLHNK